MNFEDFQLLEDRHHEEYSSEMMRIFRLKHTPKTITFQVTEDCCLSCKYCLGGETPILMADYTTKPIKDIQINDEIIGFPEFPEKGKQDKIIKTKVLHIFKHKDNVLKITLDNDETILITENHKVLVRRNSYMNHSCDFVPIGNLKCEKGVRVYPLAFKAARHEEFIPTDNYKIGYLVGMLKGDGSLKQYISKEGYNVFKFRLAVKDIEIINRVKSYLDDFNFDTYLKPFLVSKKESLYQQAIFSNTEKTYNHLVELYHEHFRKNKTKDYFLGYLAGFYDAEGSIGESRTIRITNTDQEMIEEGIEGLKLLDINYVIEKAGLTINNKQKLNIRIDAGRDSINSFKFLSLIHNALPRKNINNFFNWSPLKSLKIKSVESLNEPIDVYNLETDCHTYIANGVAVHNCYQHDKKKTHMTPEIGHAAIDWLLASTPENNPYINPENSPAIIIDFIGGEPLMEIDLIEDLICYFKRRTIELNHPWAFRHRFSICSNGVLYFDPRVQSLLQKYGNEISFSISIDGTKELHDACRIFPDGRGSYDIAVKGALHYQEHYGHGAIGSKMTLAPENIKFTCSAVENLLKLNYKSINLNCIFEEGWTNKDASILYQQLKQIADFMIEKKLYKDTTISMFSLRCGHPLDEKDNENYCGGAGQGGMMAINYLGNIYPCLRYMESSVGDNQPPMIIGNIFEGIGTHLEEQKRLKLLNAVTRRSQSTDKCWTCPIASNCGNCSAYSYEKFGTPDHRATFICPMHIARVLANVYYWNRVFQQENMKERFKNYVPKEWALDIIDENEFNLLNKLSEVF